MLHCWYPLNPTSGFIIIYTHAVIEWIYIKDRLVASSEEVTIADFPKEYPQTRVNEVPGLGRAPSLF